MKIFATRLAAIGALASFLFIFGCGQSTPTSLTNLASLPAATGGIGSANSVVLPSVGQPLSDPMSVATTGLALSAVGTTNWSGKSRAMCETGNALVDLYQRTGQADQALCFVGQFEKQSLLPTGFYDGNDHYFTLTTGGIPWMYLKFNATKGGVQVATFNMWACVSVGSVVPSAQNVYLGYDLRNASAVAITAVTSVSANLGILAASYSGSASVTGAVDSNGAWTSKSLAAQSYLSGTASVPSFTFTDAGAVNVAQTASGWTLTANKTGTESVVGGTFSGCTGTPAKVNHSASLYVVGDGLNLGNPATVALGDGAAKGSYTYAFADASSNPVTGGSCSVAGVNSQVSSWLGDTQTVTASNADTAGVQSATLGSSPAVPTSAIGFTGSQVWNCQAASGNSFTSIEIDLSTLNTVQSACNAKYQLSSSWALCSAGSL